MPVILATEEAEIRRLAVRSQSEEIVRETLSRKYPTRKRGWQRGSLWLPAGLAIISPCFQASGPSTTKKKKKKKKSERQVIE
jgi:hypothetical protein